MPDLQSIVSILQNLTIWVIPALFAITLHEVAHGFVANLLGDGTAKMLGRITINPIKHIDIIGTIVVPSLLYFTSGFIFGWAKPVPVNFNNLNKPNRDMILVAIAGPGANFIMAILWGLLIVIAVNLQSVFLLEMGKFGIIINLILAVFNLLPIPPLDGAKVISPILPRDLAYYFDKIEPYGLFIVLGLIFLGGFQAIILPIVNYLQVILLDMVRLFL